MSDEPTALAGGLSDDEKAELVRLQLRQVLDNQRFLDALTGGMLAAVLCAVLWALVTIASGTQIGFMAIGVGAAVGFTVRIFGRGVTRRYAALGAILSLAACLAGNALAVIGLIAKEGGIGYFYVLSAIEPPDLASGMVQSLEPIDALFYLIAAYEGYRFSVLRIPLQGLRVPEAMLRPLDRRSRMLRGAFLASGTVLLAAVLYGLRFTGGGQITFRYDSGAVSAVGEMRRGKPQGQWRYWHESGELMGEKSWTDGRQDGISTLYYRDGTIEESFLYRSGLPHGPAASYYPGGAPRTRGDFRNGRRHGPWTGWYESGDTMFAYRFSMGELDGLCIDWHENGWKKREGRHEKGSMTGVWTEWGPDGTVRARLRHSGDSVYVLFARDGTDGPCVIDGDGTYRSYHENGSLESEGTVRGGVRTGVWREWYDSGALMREYTCAGEPETVLSFRDAGGNPMISGGEGEYVALYPDSSIMAEGKYEDGLRSGEFRFYRADGALWMLQTYERGLLHGTHTVWHAGGTVESTGEFRRGKRSGLWIWYHEDGIKSSTATFVDGRKQGRQLHWDEFGTLVLEEEYENGELVGEKIL